MMRRFTAGACAAALLFALTVPATAGPTAAEILKKTQAAVNGAKTYQATILVSNNAGKLGSMNLRMDVKTSGNKSAITTSVIGQPTGQLAMAAAMSGTQIIDDGQNMWVYNTAMKSYSKRPSTGGKGANNPFKDISGLTKNANVAVVGTENIAGKPAYVVQITPKVKGKGAPDKVLIYIDQASYHMRQMKMNTSAASPQGTQAISMVMQVQNERLNAPIPDAVFHFTPPPGAKEMQGGGFMGGMGRPGGAPVRR